MKYCVDGQDLYCVGFNGIKQVYYFTRVAKDKNESVEVPYSFDGIIYSYEKEVSKNRPLEVSSPAHQEWLGSL